MNNKKKDMLSNIIETSIPIFAKIPYEDVALSQICQEAKIANGTIYNYFNSKEELFKFLLNQTCIRLSSAFSKIKGKTIEEKLENFIQINISMTKKGLHLVTIFREGQYRFPEYEQKLRDLYIRSFEFIFEKKIDETEYLYLTAGIRFIKIKYTTNKTKLDIKFLSKIILNGIFSKTTVNFTKIKDQTLYKVSPFLHNYKKNSLLTNGEILFGKYGYNNVKISDITKASNYAIGSFYSYFEKKEQFLEEIITQIITSLSLFLKFNTENISSLFEKHLMYLLLNITFFENHTYRYQIIREAEFVSKQMSKEYFNNLEDIYMESFLNSNYTLEEKKIISNFLIGIAHYMGIELFFTKNLHEKFSTVEKLSDFLLYGTKGD